MDRNHAPSLLNECPPVLLIFVCLLLKLWSVCSDELVFWQEEVFIFFSLEVVDNILQIIGVSGEITGAAGPSDVLFHESIQVYQVWVSGSWGEHGCHIVMFLWSMAQRGQNGHTFLLLKIYAIKTPRILWEVRHCVGATGVLLSAAFSGRLCWQTLRILIIILPRLFI